jgi:hypothetical protein
MTAALLIAMLTKRAFLMDFRGPFDLASYFFSPHIQWPFDPQVLPSSASQATIPLTSSIARNRLPDVFGSLDVIFAPCHSTLVLPLLWNRNSWHRKELRAFSVASTADAFGCLSRFLLHPKPFLQSALDSMLPAPSRPLLSIHIRYGESEMAHQTTNARVREFLAKERNRVQPKDIPVLWGCVHQLTQTLSKLARHSNGTVAYFFATDTARFVTEAHQQFGKSRVLSTEGKPVSTDFPADDAVLAQKGNFKALLDWLLLSRGDLFVYHHIARSNTFAAQAEAYSLQPAVHSQRCIVPAAARRRLQKVCRP